MSADTAEPIEKPEPAAESPEFPPETAFWKRYNDRLEMPTSIIGSICAHAALIFVLIFVLFKLMNPPQKPIIPIMMVDGEDDKGVGSAGSGGVADPVARGFSAPTQDELNNMKLPSPLPKVKQDIDDIIKLDSPNADIKMPDHEYAAISQLDAALQKKMLGIGQQKGDGPSTGRGTTGQVGDGPGGYGSDSTRARSMRWVMRFQVQDGRDYLRQLALMKATVLVPIPPDNKEMMIFKDLTTGAPNRPATSAEMDVLLRQMRFCDITQKAVVEIAQTYKLNFTPQSFFAFFPKELEEKLARDEENFRGRKSKDIEETIFSVTITGQSFSIRIVDQTAKKK